MVDESHGNVPVAQHDASPDEGVPLFDRLAVVEVQTVVRIPGVLTEDGQAMKYDYRQLVPVERVGLTNIAEQLPKILERFTFSLLWALHTPPYN